MNRIEESFLRRQFEDGMALAADSDLLDLVPASRPFDIEALVRVMSGGAGSAESGDFGDRPPRCYLARFTCRGLVATKVGEIKEAEEFLVSVRFPEGYLNREFEPAQVLAFEHPAAIFHPNICVPIICIGTIARGTPLTDLLHAVFDLITYQRFNCANYLRGAPPAEAACQWARRHLDRFPVDARPLRWKRGNTGSEKQAG